MTGMLKDALRLLRDTGWVAVYEVSEALRTRLFQIAVVVYVGGIGAGNATLILALHRMEAEFAEMLGVPTTRRPGSMLGALQESGRLTEVLSPFVGEADAARLLDDPILAIWASAVGTLLIPLLLLFTSSGSVATEVQSRSIRYLLVRADRLAIVGGKALGHLLFGVVAVGVGVFVTLLMSQTLMVAVAPGPLVWSLATRGLLSLSYALPALGIGLFASQVVPSPNGARLVAILTYLALPILVSIADEYTSPTLPGRLLDLFQLFTWSGLWGRLWSFDLHEMIVAVAHAAAVGLFWFSLGFARFLRRAL